MPRSRKRGRRGPPSPAAGSTAAASRATTPPAAGSAATADRAPARPQIRDAQSPPAHLPRESRSEARNAEIRATLKPYEPGERPVIVSACSLIALALGLGELVAWLAGATISGKHPAAGGIIAFTVIFVICGVGMWQMWYAAVLGFEALMAIIVILFTLFLIEASNWFSAAVALAIIAAAGYLFFKLVRILSRMQTPPAAEARPPTPPR